MLSSARFLLALLWGIRQYIGCKLKSFIQRYVLQNLRHVWSLCSRTSPKDVSKKKRGQERPLFPGTSGGCEGYSTINASRFLHRASEPHLPLRLSNSEVFPLSPTVGQPQSAPRSPASSASSLPGSPHSERQPPEGSTTSIHRSYNADIQSSSIRYLNTPLTLTHSRTTSTQFAGVPPAASGRSRAQSSSSQPQPLLQPNTLERPTASPGHPRSPSSSPYLYSQHQTLLQPSLPPDVVPNPHNSSEGQPIIILSPPAMPQATGLPVDSQGTFNIPQSPLSF